MTGRTAGNEHARNTPLPAVRPLFYTLPFLLLLLLPGVFAYEGPFFRPDGATLGVASGNKCIAGTYNGIDWPGVCLSGGSEEKVSVFVKNEGSQWGQRYCELGVYKRDTINGWYGKGIIPLAFAVPTGNCVPVEENVDTYSVGLSPGEGVTLMFNVKTPPVGIFTGDRDDYGVHVHCFQRCATFGQDPLADGHIAAPILLSPSGITQPPPSCTDRIRNGDESDIDCGGSCPDCGERNTCRADSDCAAPMLCRQSEGSVYARCLQPSSVSARCGDGVADPGEDCQSCPGDLPSSACERGIPPPACTGAACTPLPRNETVSGGSGGESDSGVGVLGQYLPNIIAGIIGAGILTIITAVMLGRRR